MTNEPHELPRPNLPDIRGFSDAVWHEAHGVQNPAYPDRMEHARRLVIRMATQHAEREKFLDLLDRAGKQAEKLASVADGDPVVAVGLVVHQLKTLVCSLPYAESAK